MNVNTTDLKKYLSFAIEAALAGGREIMEVYTGTDDIEIQKKGDHSPLTLADRRAHDAIQKILKEHAPGIPILSEEGRDIPYPERKSWERFWLVDPLDGTKEFINRNGEFTVNIALIEKGQPALGAVYVPVKQTLYYGGPGFGSYIFAFNGRDVGVKSMNTPPGGPDMDTLVSESGRLPLNSNDGPAKQAFRVVASRSHMNEATEKFINQLKEKHGEIDLVPAGSSLKLCLVAEGTADVYPRLGPTMEWDTAAAHAVVTGAGKKVNDYKSGEALSYNKEELLNPWFVVG